MIKQTRRVLAGTILAVAACGLIVDAAAQNPSKAVISGTAAKRAQTNEEISLDAAQKVVQATIDCAKQHNVNVAVFVLAPTGAIVSAGRMDGQSKGNIVYAQKRAETIINWHPTFSSTRDPYNQGEGIGNLNRTIRFYSQDGYPVPGGLSIMADDIFVGAVGVGGSVQWNEYCAYDALTKVVGPQPPLAEILPPPTQFQPAPPRFPPPPPHPVQPQPQR